MLPLSVVIMLGLMYTGIMMDTAIQEAPRSYYVRRQMPVAEPDEPEEPVMMVESEEPRNSVVEPDNIVKWLDVFHVNHEVAVWRMRLEEHWDYIDEFHVFESSISHRGTEKQMLFNESGLLNGKYTTKLRYHAIPAPANYERCKTKGNWECENHDRRFIGNTMRDLIRPNDIIVFTDADEILSRDTLQTLHVETFRLPLKINTPAFKYSLHWAEDQTWTKGIVACGKTALKFKDWNDLRRKNDFKRFANGGWHISTFGSIEDIMNKGRHSRSARLYNKEETERRVRSGISLYDKPQTKHFTYVDHVTPLPKLAMSEPDFFEEHFMRYGKILDNKESPIQHISGKTIGGGIPRSIIQTMRPPVPPYVKKAWTKLNPEFEYLFFDDVDARRFIEENYAPVHVDLFDKLKQPKYKADLFRYCYLYKNGGIYADIDLQPLVPLVKFIHPTTQFFSVWTGTESIMQAYLAVVPKSPFMKQAIDRMLQVGTSFESVGPPYKTHPVRDLYIILNDTLHSGSVREGIMSTDMGVVQLSREHCPSYSDCYIENDGMKIANTRYAKWVSGRGFLTI